MAAAHLSTRRCAAAYFSAAIKSECGLRHPYGCRVSFFFGAAFFRAAQLSLDLPGKNCYDTIKIKLAPKELERAMIKKELTSRKKQAMEMRSRIQAVALELFDKEGFENVSVEQIAQAAGCSVGNIYHYFKSKDELVIQVTSSVDAQYSVLEESYLADEANSWHDKLLDFVGQALVISANDPSLYRSFIHGIRYPQQGILRDNEKRVYFRVLRELVDGCKQEGSVHAGRDREELVADLVALHRGMLLEWRIYEGTFDLPRRGRRMAAALLEGWRHEEE